MQPRAGAPLRGLDRWVTSESDARFISEQNMIRANHPRAFSTRDIRKALIERARAHLSNGGSL